MTEPSVHDPHPSQAAVLDMQRGLRQTGGRQTLYWSLLGLFAEHHRDAAGALRQLMAAGDRAAAQRAAHSLRGSAAQIGATTVEREAGVVEDALRRGETGEAVAVQLTALERPLAALLAVLDTQSPSLTPRSGFPRSRE